MKILALETSTEILSLCCRAESRLCELTRSMDLRHAEEVIPLTDWILSQAAVKARELDLVVVSGGPGSFTGLRIGMATAQGLAAGADCALVTVPSLDAYGYSACPDTVTLPLIDAKKKRFYAAFYRGGKRLSDYMDATPEELLEKAAAYPKVLLCGPHAALFRERLGQCAELQNAVAEKFSLDPDAQAGKAAVLLRLGHEAFLRGEAPQGLFYLREPETT